MKKIRVTMVLVLALAVMLSGCGKETGDEGAFSHSRGLTEKGYFEGVSAKELVALGDYANIKVPASEVALSEDAVENEVQYILSEYSERTQLTEGVVENYDMVNIDYAGKIDGVAFEGGSAEGTDLLIGSGNFIPGFEEAIIGHTPGEVFDINVTFPEAYENNPDLAGKPAVFTVTLNCIVDYKAPELTDAFVAEKLSGEYKVTTVTDFYAAVEKKLKDAEIDTYVRAIVSAYEVKSVPDQVMKFYEDSVRNYYEEYSKMNNMTVDEFIVYMGSGATNMTELLELYRDQLTENAKAALRVQAIAEDAGIESTEEDVKAFFLENTGSEDYSSHEERFGTNYLRYLMLSDKVYNYLKEKAVIE